MGAQHLQRLPHDRRGQGDLLLGSQSGNLLKRVVPAVHGQIEGAVVHRIEPFPPEIVKRLRRLRREHVHQLPALVVGPGLEKGHVERTVAPANLLETVEVAAVTAEEEVDPLAANDPGGPEGLVAVPEATAGEMLGRGRYQGDTAHPGLLPPVQFADLLLRNPPGHEARPHPEGRDEVADLLLQRQYGPVIEMVVVIMGEDHPLDGRQRFQGDGRLMPALGAEPLHRRGPLAEHGIRQPERALQLQQQSGVAEAPHAVVRRRDDPLPGHDLYRNGAIRHRALRLGEQEVPPEPGPFPEASRLGCHGIVEPSPLILRGVRVFGQARFE